MAEPKVEKLSNGGIKETYTNGLTFYFAQNGGFHREDGPAVIYADGSKEWWVNGNLHRENEPAWIYHDGHKEWWVDGKKHRIDGPAVIFPDGNEEWWFNGERHRSNGPAVIGPNGHKEWWIKGNKLEKEDFTSIEMVSRTQAWELFTPKELLKMKNG